MTKQQRQGGHDRRREEIHGGDDLAILQKGNPLPAWGPRGAGCGADAGLRFAPWMVRVFSLQGIIFPLAPHTGLFV
jgi:hypothetical protein